MKAPDLAEKLARTAKANKSKERKAEEEIASAAHESTTYLELWDAKASDIPQLLHVQERGFYNALGEIAQNVRAFRDLFKPSHAAPLSCSPALLLRITHLFLLSQ